MTRGQRRAHAWIARVLAVGLVVALGFAIYRRTIAASTEDAMTSRSQEAQP